MQARLSASLFCSQIEGMSKSTAGSAFVGGDQQQETASALIAGMASVSPTEVEQLRKRLAELEEQVRKQQQPPVPLISNNESTSSAVGGSNGNQLDVLAMSAINEANINQQNNYVSSPTAAAVGTPLGAPSMLMRTTSSSSSGPQMPFSLARTSGNNLLPTGTPPLLSTPFSKLVFPGPSSQAFSFPGQVSSPSGQTDQNGSGAMFVQSFPGAVVLPTSSPNVHSSSSSGSVANSLGHAPYSFFSMQPSNGNFTPFLPTSSALANGTRSVRSVSTGSANNGNRGGGLSAMAAAAVTVERRASTGSASSAGLGPHANTTGSKRGRKESTSSFGGNDSNSRKAIKVSRDKSNSTASLTMNELSNSSGSGNIGSRRGSKSSLTNAADSSSAGVGGGGGIPSPFETRTLANGEGKSRIVVPVKPEAISVVKRKGTVMVLKWGGPPLAIERTIRGVAFVPDGFEVETISDRMTWIGQTRVLRNAVLQYRFHLKSDPSKAGGWHKNASRAYRDAFAQIGNVPKDQLDHLKSSNGRLIIGVTYGNLQDRIRKFFGEEIVELERKIQNGELVASSGGEGPNSPPPESLVDPSPSPPAADLQLVRSPKVSSSFSEPIPSLPSLNARLLPSDISPVTSASSIAKEKSNDGDRESNNNHKLTGEVIPGYQLGMDPGHVVDPSKSNGDFALPNRTDDEKEMVKYSSLDEEQSTPDGGLTEPTKRIKN